MTILGAFYIVILISNIIINDMGILNPSSRWANWDMEKLISSLPKLPFYVAGSLGFNLCGLKSSIFLLCHSVAIYLQECLFWDEVLLQKYKNI